MKQSSLPKIPASNAERITPPHEPLCMICSPFIVLVVLGDAKKSRLKKAGDASGGNTREWCCPVKNQSTVFFLFLLPFKPEPPVKKQSNPWCQAE